LYNVSGEIAYIYVDQDKDHPNFRFVIDTIGFISTMGVYLRKEDILDLASIPADWPILDWTASQLGQTFSGLLIDIWIHDETELEHSEELRLVSFFADQMPILWSMSKLQFWVNEDRKLDHYAIFLRRTSNLT
jgi:hypothetical protein